MLTRSMKELDIEIGGCVLRAEFVSKISNRAAASEAYDRIVRNLGCIVSKMRMAVNEDKIIASSSNDLETARTRYYDRLATHFMEQIGQRRPRVILEAGCGKGQLTIPLISKLPRNVKMIAIDSSAGPYAGWLKELAKKLRTDGSEKRVRLIRSDARRIKSVEDESVDVVVSNELLCDLPYDKLLKRDGIELPFEHIVQCQK